MKILISEETIDCIRVFIDYDYSYGYFVNKNVIHQLLSIEQLDTYYNKNRYAEFELDDSKKEIIVDYGITYINGESVKGKKL